VLPLWRSRIGIALSPAKVTLVQFARGLRPRLANSHHEMVRADSGNTNWQGSVQALQKILQQPEWRQGEATVVLSNHFMRYATIPWNDEIGGEDEEKSFALHQLAKVYGESALDWNVRLTQSGQADTRMVGAIDAELGEAITALFGQPKSRLRSVQPYLMSVFNHFRKRLGKGAAWFVVAEPARLCVALLHEGKWHLIRSHADDRLENLTQLLDRENLLSGLKEPCHKVFLFAPENRPNPVADTLYEWIPLTLPGWSGVTEPENSRFAMAVSGVI